MTLLREKERERACDGGEDAVYGSTDLEGGGRIAVAADCVEEVGRVRRCSVWEVQGVRAKECWCVILRHWLF